MAVYAVGDIHGCFDAFQRLLSKLRFNPRADTLWQVGDAVNRGADSLAVLRWLRRHSDSVVMTLGNHDLHLLALWAGVGDRAEHPTLADIFAAPDCDELCGWLRRRRLAHYENGFLMVHAGALPMWRVADVMRLAGEAEAAVAGDDWRRRAGEMYGDEPAAWDESLRGAARLRVIINALTRLRICTAAGEMRMDFSGAAAPAGYAPWFDAPRRRTAGAPIVCGHWSALGVVARDDLLALDSGCLWGGGLTAARLSDRKIFQVAS